MECGWDEECAACRARGKTFEHTGACDFHALIKPANLDFSELAAAGEKHREKHDPAESRPLYSEEDMAVITAAQGGPAQTKHLTELPKWLISDTHFLHKNISEFCRRTTPTVPTPEAVDRLMVDNWNGTVGPRDTILHLGDLIFTKGEDAPILRELNGNKFIILGNHDRKRKSWYEEHGFTVIKPFNMDYAGWSVAFDHYPIHPKKMYPRTISVFGHVHSNPTEGLTKTHLNMSVEVWHYCPQPTRVMLDKVINGIQYADRDFDGKGRRA